MKRGRNFQPSLRSFLRVLLTVLTDRPASAATVSFDALDTQRRGSLRFEQPNLTFGGLAGPLRRPCGATHEQAVQRALQDLDDEEQMAGANLAVIETERQALGKLLTQIEERLFAAAA